MTALDVFAALWLGGALGTFAWIITEGPKHMEELRVFMRSPWPARGFGLMAIFLLISITWIPMMLSIVTNTYPGGKNAGGGD